MSNNLNTCTWLSGLRGFSSVVKFLVYGFEPLSSWSRGTYYLYTGLGLPSSFVSVSLNSNHGFGLICTKNKFHFFIPFVLYKKNFSLSMGLRTPWPWEWRTHTQIRSLVLFAPKTNFNFLYPLYFIKEL